MTHARVAGGGVGARQARPWLASITRAGLARPPIPPRGLGLRPSGVGGSLAPPAATARGSARPGSRLASPTPTPTAGGPGEGHGISGERLQPVATLDLMMRLLDGARGADGGGGVGVLRSRLVASRASRALSGRGERAADARLAPPHPRWGMGGRANPARAIQASHGATGASRLAPGVVGLGRRTPGIARHIC